MADGRTNPDPNQWTNEQKKRRGMMMRPFGVNPAMQDWSNAQAGIQQSVGNNFANWVNPRLGPRIRPPGLDNSNLPPQGSPNNYIATLGTSYPQQPMSNSNSQPDFNEIRAGIFADQIKKGASRAVADWRANQHIAGLKADSGRNAWQSGANTIKAGINSYINPIRSLASDTRNNVGDAGQRGVDVARAGVNSYINPIRSLASDTINNVGDVGQQGIDTGKSAVQSYFSPAKKAFKKLRKLW